MDKFTFFQGGLVKSKLFEGTGKIYKICGDMVEISFFESPLNPDSHRVELKKSDLFKYSLKNETTVYFCCCKTNLWRRGRYGGSWPGGLNLIIPKSGEREILRDEEIYILNVGQTSGFKPSEFIAAKANDAPFYFELRDKFVKNYIKQRAACRSISSISSSRVELEPHQLAVVSRVLRDGVQKYLLADEVGLGKTIEAGIIIREHILVRGKLARVLITVPSSIRDQWDSELSDRLLLSSDVLNTESEFKLIELCSHDELEEKFKIATHFTLVVVDEVHHLSPLAWSSNSNQKTLFSQLASFCNHAESTLLLSGTPLNGNEKNFLAMLHCLNSEAYALDKIGLEKFRLKVKDRERLGGMFSALSTTNDNGTLEVILNEVVDLYPDDYELRSLVDKTLPHVDFFSPEQSQEKEDTIKSLRRYIGENYRIHQRMLRNRRENDGLSMLFPGLSGIEYVNYCRESVDVTLDSILDQYRLEAFDSPGKYICLDKDSNLEWVDALFESPLSLSRKAKAALEKHAGQLTKEEETSLQDIVKQGPIEQAKKDDVLIEYLENWLVENPEGKAVIFCNSDSVASHIQLKLEMALDFTTERHEERCIPKFCSDKNVRVLVCDIRGQDGLNLHGGTRLAIHYSLTRNLSQIEQRLGRLNRYSANLRSVKPVKSLALTSDTSSLSRIWLNLLDEDIQIFNQTVASLQYVLADFLGDVWSRHFAEGDFSLIKAGDALRGDNGLIAIERKKVRAQEELLSLDEDVQAAIGFADELYEVDEEVELQPNDLSDWIVKGLNFKKIPHVDDAFCFQFQTESRNQTQTLVDIDALIKNCVTGFDKYSGYPPETHPMSVNRHKATQSKFNILPLRYGQPFVDAIWNLILKDARGATCAFLRVVHDKRFISPEVYFEFTWLVSGCANNAAPVQQRQADNLLKPRIVTQWLAADGMPVHSPDDLELLNLPYAKKGAKCKCVNVNSYHDFNLRPGVWRQNKIDEWFPDREWESLSSVVSDLARKSMKSKFDQELGRNIYLEEISVKVVVLCCAEALVN